MSALWALPGSATKPETEQENQGRKNRDDDCKRKTPSDSTTIGCIAVSDEVPRRFVPREGIGDLAGNPLSRRMMGDAQGN